MVSAAPRIWLNFFIIKKYLSYAVFFKKQEKSEIQVINLN